jgi:hypothetical protein
MTGFETMMEGRSPSLDEAVPKALPENDEEPLWVDFDKVEEDVNSELMERFEGHQEWKAEQDKNPEVRNYHGPDNDAKGSLNW